MAKEFSQVAAGEADFDFILGATYDGRVLFDFRGMRCDHLKITIEQAQGLLEALPQAIQDAKDGIYMEESLIALPPGRLNS